MSETKNYGGGGLPTKRGYGNTSQLSNYKKGSVTAYHQNSVSPSRGLDDDLYKLKLDYRAKEQEYLKQIALQEQKIELLQLQLKETEDRET